MSKGDEPIRLALDLRRSNIGAFPLTAGEKPLALEGAQRAAQGEAVDAEHLAQGALGGKAAPRNELSRLDPVEQSLGDLEIKGGGSSQSAGRRLKREHGGQPLGLLRRNRSRGEDHPTRLQVKAPAGDGQAV